MISHPISHLISQFFKVDTLLATCDIGVLSCYITVLSVISQLIFVFPVFLPLVISGTSLISRRTSGLIWPVISGYADVKPDVSCDIRIYGCLHCCRYQRFLLISALICYLPRLRPPPAALARRPLPRGSNRSSLLVVRPFGGSVHRRDAPDTLVSCTFLVGWLSLTNCKPESRSSRQTSS